MSQISVACSRRALPRRICCAHPEFRHRQSANNFSPDACAGSCSRNGAAETCERGPKDKPAVARKCVHGKNKTFVVSATNHVRLSTCLLLNGLFHCQQSHVAAGVLIQLGPVPVRLRRGLCSLFFLALCNASEGPFEGTTSFRQYAFEAAILLHRHVAACFVSIALHVCNRQVFQQTLQSSSGCHAEDFRFAWALLFFESYSHAGRYNQPDLKSSVKCVHHSP